MKDNRKKVYIIAEAGVNHNGSLELALQMIDAAVAANVDAVKFQTFVAEKVISQFAPKAEYQQKITDQNETQLEMAKKFELDFDQHKKIVEYCKQCNIQFLSSPFDLESIDTLDQLGLDIIKIPSGEITNLPYLRKVGKLGKKIILSTGMSELEEIKTALEILVKAGTIRENITLLHCNTEYPTPYEDVNLQAMNTLRNEFNVNVGYSDHTLGNEVAIAAVAMGAVMIEKHFTLDKNMEGPDHKASLEPDELKKMVECVRNIEKALGDGIKKPSPSEIKNKHIARKSLVAAQDIKKDEIFSANNLTIKRPGNGISPMQWDRVIGQRAKADFKKDELIEL
ncbi:MAG: N-acetylneuraminate synthase [Candidatus Omnitrophica bacterium]|nr:N-acetylneuraminate synthase [Candidatus Omnitrophota bacterium]